MTTTIRIGLYKSEPICYEIHDDGTFGVELPPDLGVSTLAHGISLINRFAGQTPRGYNVAEHSVRLRHLVNGKYQDPVLNRAALAHDWPECLGINDLNSNIKKLLAPRIRLLEEEVMWRLWMILGFKATQPQTPISWAEAEEKIKPLDSELGDHEYRSLFSGISVPLRYRPMFLDATLAEGDWLFFWKQDGGQI